MKNYTDILVLSDTHKNRDTLRKILDDNKHVDKIFHLGDNYEDAVFIKKIVDKEVICVKGNCDYGNAPEEIAEVIEYGHKLVLTHGHNQHVKYNYENIAYYALELEAKAILFGHTHIAYTEFKDGIWLINPGTAGASLLNKNSYAIIRISKEGIIPKIFYI